MKKNTKYIIKLLSKDLGYLSTDVKECKRLIRKYLENFYTLETFKQVYDDSEDYPSLIPYNEVMNILFEESNPITNNLLNFIDNNIFYEVIDSMIDDDLISYYCFNTGFLKNSKSVKEYKTMKDFNNDPYLHEVLDELRVKYPYYHDRENLNHILLIDRADKIISDYLNNN